MAVPWLLALAVLVTLSPSVPARTTFAADNIPLPFPGGQAVRIVQGYNGGTHQGRSRYGLDLVLDDGSTSGVEVVSPIDGTVTFAQGPKVGNGCMAIALRDDSYSVMVCHVIFHRTFGRGESIARGQSLGTVGPAGTVGNNGLPHVHLELHKGGRASSPVPFGEPGGRPLEGVALSASGTSGEHGRREAIVSTNRPGSGPGNGTVASTTKRDEPPQRMAARSEPATLAAASIPSTLRSAQPSSATTSTATRLAVVRGTESCLKVRKQPSTDAPVVECLPEGAEVPLKPLASFGEARWREVERGWVASEYLKRTRAVVAGTDACLNVRESPKSGASLLGCLPDGTPVTIADGPTTGGGFSWYRIEPTGTLAKSGWVISKHLD
jgi:murein DD-endopeptidase MepM/ murein hydrolase activator NlpD